MHVHRSSYVFCSSVMHGMFLHKGFYDVFAHPNRRLKIQRWLSGRGLLYKKIGLVKNPRVYLSGLNKSLNKIDTQPDCITSLVQFRNMIMPFTTLFAILKGSPEGFLVIWGRKETIMI